MKASPCSLFCSDSLPNNSLCIMTELGKEVLGEVLLANFRVQPGSLKPAHLLQCVQHFHQVLRLF